MAQSLGQPIIVENRPGAATMIGAEAVARSAPDGYTFLLGDVATYSVNPSLYQKIAYDPEKDFSPISLTGRFAIVLLVNTNKLNVDSIAELVDAAKRAPGSIDYASGGIGNPFHLASELFAQAAQIKLNHVPYRGAAPALQDLAGGQVGMMFVDFATARSQLTTPGIKAVAVASRTEFVGLPGCRRSRPADTRASKHGRGRGSWPPRKPHRMSSQSCATAISRRSRTARSGENLRTPVWTSCKVHRVNFGTTCGTRPRSGVV